MQLVVDEDAVWARARARARARVQCGCEYGAGAGALEGDLETPAFPLSFHPLLCQMSRLVSPQFPTVRFYLPGRPKETQTDTDPTQTENSKMV